MKEICKLKYCTFRSENNYESINKSEAHIFCPGNVIFPSPAICKYLSFTHLVCFIFDSFVVLLPFSHQFPFDLSSFSFIFRNFPLFLLPYSYFFQYIHPCDQSTKRLVWTVEVKNYNHLAVRWLMSRPQGGEELRQHTWSLEEQVARLHPIINLVDNMVKLGTLYRGLNTHARLSPPRKKTEVRRRNLNEFQL